MVSLNNTKTKIVNQQQLTSTLLRWRIKSDKIVFTNGCFDILHKGHITLLAEAKSFGDRLVVGLNSDNSVKILKGETRPINNENDRALLLATISYVDLVFIFDEETPLNLIKMIKPDFLVKGADYKKEEIVGADFVEKNGGVVKTVEIVKGYSTTNIIAKNS